MTVSGKNDLWGEDEPYSQVYVTTEIRIWADQITRQFAYVHADINPATFDLLRKHRDQIGEPFVHEFLDESEPREDGNGRKWTTLSLQMEPGRETEVNEAVKKLGDQVIAMHKIVSKILAAGN